MAFDDSETSLESSRIAELYEFTYQGGTFRYTGADRDLVHSSVLWSNMQLARTKIDESGDISKATLTLTAPPDFEVAGLFDPYPPDDVVGLIVRRLQVDIDTSEVIWLGRVLSARWPRDQSELRCESVYTQMTRPGLRRIYSKNCPHLLYGSRCRVSEIAFKVDTTIDAQAGRLITAGLFDTYPDGYFAGGKLVYEPTPGYLVRRGIRQHAGDTIMVTHPIKDLPNGASVSVWPGCNHTTEHCVEKFDNLENYGGFPGMKQKNPFGQSSVF